MSIFWTFLLFVFAAIGCVLVVVHFLARMLLQPPRMSDGKALYLLKRMSPSDLGLPFETMWFESGKTPQSAAIRIAAWWIDASQPSAKTVVVIHGYGDAKVGALAWAPTWRDLGFNCLLIDLRGHGESGGSLTTGGVLERDDLDAVINSIVTLKPAQTKQIALFGISLGGAVALACAARREDIAAVVCDSTFADYASAATAHGKLIGVPLPSLLPWVMRWAQKLAGVEFAEARPAFTLAACSCPVMLIHGEADPFVSKEQVSLLSEALIARQNPKDAHLVVADAYHVLALPSNTQLYQRQLAGFLQIAITPE